MPSCFSLTPRFDPEHGPMVLAHIDDVLRKVYGHPPNDKAWLMGWYDRIGLALACGQSFEEIIASLDKQILELEVDSPYLLGTHLQRDIAKWLDHHFIANAWREQR